MRDVKIREKIHRGEWEVEIGCQTFRYEDPVELASDLLEYMTTEYPYDFEQAYLQENRHRTVGSYSYVEETSETTEDGPAQTRQEEDLPFLPSLIPEHLRMLYREAIWDPFERRRAMEGNPNAHLDEERPEESVRNPLYDMFEKIHNETGLSYESMYQLNRLLMPPIGQEGREHSTGIDRILTDLIRRSY